jgi:hydroxypyruvate isomerase
MVESAADENVMMPSHSLPYLANRSLLFAEHPVLQRAAAAKASGFDAAEFWWPFGTAVPADAEVDAFVRSITDAGVRLVGLNFFAGDLAGPDCGVISIPALRQRHHARVRFRAGYR